MMMHRAQLGTSAYRDFSSGRGKETFEVGAFGKANRVVEGMGGLGKDAQRAPTVGSGGRYRGDKVRCTHPAGTRSQYKGATRL